jgi:hypothetical protein
MLLDEQIDGRIRLPKNERLMAVLDFDVTMYQYAEKTVKLNHGGFRGNIKITKGISYNMGSTNLDFKKEKYLKLISTGEIFISDKHFYHLGSEKVTKIPFNKILDFGMTDKGFVIQRDSGKPMLFGLDKIHAIFITEVMEKAFE